MPQYMTKPGSTHSAFDGISVKHVYNNPHTHRNILFSQDENIFNSTLVCASGVSNVDNACLCPGSPNSAPFNPERVNTMRGLFVPENPATFSEPTPAARCLMAERRPIHPHAPYEPYLGSC